VDKKAWLADYSERHGWLKPTRDRIEILCRELLPIRVLELNLYHDQSKSEASLQRDKRDTELFEYLLDACRPSVLIVHGRSPPQNDEH
jgi:hypothetical protein